MLTPRAEELLAERALRALDDKEHWELQQLGATDDESFDIAAAAVMVATTVLEPMPRALADKILAAAPGGTGGGLDWRRTLPGVAMPPPPEQPRDTMVSVNLSDLQAEIDEHGSRGADLEKSTEPLIAQKAPTLTKAMPVPAASPDTLPPPMRGRVPAIAAPSLVTTSDAEDPHDLKVTLPAENRDSEPFVSQEPLEPHVRFAQVLTPQPQSAVKAPITPPQQQALVPVAPQRPSAPPDGRTPLPQDSQPFSVETPPMAVPISRDRLAPQTILPPDELAARRAAQRQSAETVPLKKPSRGVAPWLAAAACLLVAGGAVWWGMQQRGDKPVPVASEPTPADARAALVASATDLTKITWTATQDLNAHGATGDVVWSAAQQKGYMRFVGLTPNDPKQFQYQLWIFDKTRDQAFPVDGGVFDVGSNGEVIVPISPKLHVNDLALFAVTVEKPGGVVVSKRERIVVTAART